MSKAIFKTHDTVLREFNKTEVEVIGPIPQDSYDYIEVGPMFFIKTENGTELQAFEDELEWL